MSTEWEITTSNWLAFSVYGVLFGAILAWFWAQGRAWEHICRGGKKPFGFSPKPKEQRITPDKYAGIPPKIISIVGLAACLVGYHLYVVKDTIGHGISGFMWAESSGTLFLLLTWGIIIFLVDKTLTKSLYIQNQTKED